MPKILVLFHKGCADGWGAAWAASLTLGRGRDIRYIPCQYGEPLPDEVQESGSRWAIGNPSDDGVATVYMLDFSTDRQTAINLARRLTCPVVIIDHHASAEKELAGLDGSDGVQVRFDMAKSGAVLSWEYFCRGQPLPEILSYVQDRDLWEWKLPESREISAFLASHPRTFELWDQFAANMEYPAGIEKYAAEGGAILRYQDGIVGSLAAKAMPIKVGSHVFHAVNSPVLQSEICNRILDRNPGCSIAACFFVSQSGDTVYSLRSRGDVDVSLVAKEFGGGGHPKAAGFTVSRKQDKENP